MRSGAWLLTPLLGLMGCRFGFDRQNPGSGSDDAALDGDGAVVEAFKPYWVSGTRMRARLLEPIEGGDPIWIGWYDSLLDMACRSGVASDGAERCIHEDVRANQFFSDAACTVPLAWVRPKTCGSDTHAYNFDGMGRYRNYAVGPLHTGTIYMMSGTCVATGNPGGELHALGTEILPTDMMGAMYQNVTVGDFKRPMQGFVDGAAVEIGSLFTPTATCYPIANQLGPSPCFAAVPRATEVYLDGGCTQRALLWDRFSYEPLTTSQLAVFDLTSCANSYRLFQTVADVTQGNYFKQTPSLGCQGFVTPAIAKLYTGTEIAKDLPDGEIVVGPRRGRLGYLYWVGPDQQPLVVKYWDHDLQMPCLPINAADGKLRCQPAKTAWNDAYPNATCSGGTQTLAPACFPGTPVDGPDYVSCRDTFTVNTLPNIGTSSSVFGDSCNVLSLPGGYFDTSMPGAAVDPTMFAEMTEVIE